MVIFSYYLICTIVSTLLLLSILAITKHHNALHILFFVFVCISDFGYLFLSVSKDLNEAILANKISYIGCFLPFLIILSNARFCKIQLPKILVILLAAMNALQLFFINSIGHFDFYYRSAKLGNFHGSTYLIKDYGPAHNYYVIMLILETLFSALIVFYAYRHQSKVSYGTVTFLGLGVGFTIIVFFVERLIHLEVELVPISYLLMSIFYLMVTYRAQLYDFSVGIISVYEQQKNYLCISFDPHLRLMDYNDNALAVYPELARTHIDSDRYDPATPFFHDIISWIGGIGAENNADHEKILPMDGRLYKATLRKRFTRNGKLLGYVLEVGDDTAFQNNLQLMVQTMDDLKKAELDAVNANRAKSDFLANMSHEIRTPINAIVGMDEMILRESGEEKIREYAGYIQEASASLVSLINDILDFSKIEAGKMELVEGSYSLGRMIRSVYQMMLPRITDKKLDIIMNVDPDLPDLLIGDENRVKQILINIFSNAVKYTMEGSITFSVDRSFDDPGDPSKIALRFRVQDTGIGIRPEDQDRLFDSFERLDSRRNRNVEGTGLGLAITKRLVDQMNGELTVDSIYGSGSTFTVTLVQKVERGDKIGAWDHVEPLLHEKQERRVLHAPNMRILVVDDNRMNLKVVQKLLSDSELIIDTAKSGPEAIRMTSQNRYDLILMDHYMPDMDGVEAMNAIHAMGPEYADLPVVALTANAISGSRETYLSYGFREYLSKPIVYANLIAILEKYQPA